MSGDVDPRLTAGVGMLGRVGAVNVQIRSSDDEQPVVWMAVATFDRDGIEVHEAAAGLAPVDAVMRLCERVIDGGTCVHCGRLAGFEPDHSVATDTLLDRALGACWYQWDPELATFRRSCEGDQP